MPNHLPAPALSPLPDVPPDVPRLRILLVEDDPNDAELMQACVAEAARGGANVEIVHAENLAEGLRALETQSFHVTVLDLDLPDSSGFDTLERFAAAARAPIIVLTGNPHPALVAEALRRRAHEVLRKSEVDARTLMRIVVQLRPPARQPA